MPTVEKVSGGRVLVRDIGRFEVGDQADVSDDEAAYLCDERGDFDLVESDGGEEAESGASGGSGDDATDGSDADDGDNEPASDDYDVDLSSRADLSGLNHDELKAVAEQLGIDDDVDLRSKDTIVDGVLDHVTEG